MDKTQPIVADPMEALTRGLEAALGIVFEEKTIPIEDRKTEGPVDEPAL